MKTEDVKHVRRSQGVPKCVYVYHEHVKFVENHDLNYSLILRKAIEELMEAENG